MEVVEVAVEAVEEEVVTNKVPWRKGLVVSHGNFDHNSTRRDNISHLAERTQIRLAQLLTLSMLQVRTDQMELLSATCLNPESRTRIQ
jgi:pyruvate kinase